MGITTDRNDPQLTYGVDEKPVPQAEKYLVLDEKERAKGFVRPLRYSYRHLVCQTITTMGTAIAETYARNPKFYGATYCVACEKHRPLAEFVWNDDNTMVGS